MPFNPNESLQSTTTSQLQTDLKEELYVTALFKINDGPNYSQNEHF
jgi:hypothetical protein